MFHGSKSRSPLRDHSYSTSKRVGRVRRMAIFADCNNAEIVGGWVGGSKKVPKYDDVIHKGMIPNSLI